ncbi:PrpF domain-containing protein [Streptomyces sp. NPDC046805]|uniref:PrpF domain-containing protein n=1 Tax=Streptomyces sp. NPDC046805 TaxID=3155134 RepID=UPI0033C95A86
MGGPGGQDLAGGTVSGAGRDVHVRAVSTIDVHKAFMGTGSVWAGVSARLKRIVVHAVTRARAHESGECRLAHPSGVTWVHTDLEQSEGEPVVTRASFQRTARRMLEGPVLEPTARLPWGKG